MRLTAREVLTALGRAFVHGKEARGGKRITNEGRPKVPPLAGCKGPGGLSVLRELATGTIVTAHNMVGDLIFRK